MSIEKKMGKVKKFQLQSMSNAIICINHRFAFKNSGIASVIDNSAPKNLTLAEVHFLYWKLGGKQIN